jgi:hypothetical protein
MRSFSVDVITEHNQTGHSVLLVENFINIDFTSFLSTEGDY